MWMEQLEGHFLLDSGATRVIHPHKSIFKNYTVPKTPRYVKIANGDRLLVRGVGDIPIHMLTSSGKVVTKVLRNCWHVPDATLALLSTRRLMEVGVSTVFDADSKEQHVRLVEHNQLKYHVQLEQHERT